MRWYRDIFLTAVRPAVFLLLGVICALLVVRPSFGAEYGWEFEKGGDLSDWSAGNETTKIELKGGSLVVTDDRVPKVGTMSPGRVPGKMGILHIRAASEQAGYLLVGLVTEFDGRRHLKKLNARLRGGGAYRDYRFYVGDMAGGSGALFMVVMEFPGTVKVRLESVTFNQSNALDIVRVFFTPDFIRSSTIGFVTPPSFGSYSFVTLLYLAGALAALLLFIRYVRKARPGTAFPRAVVGAFVAIGLLFALRMDYNWLVQWSDDVETFSGKDVGERQGEVYKIYRADMDEFFEFAGFVRKSVPMGRAVRPALRQTSDILALLAKYFMLPVRTSEKAEYIWTYDDPVHYDPIKRALISDSAILASPVRLVGAYGVRGALYVVEEQR